MRSRVFVAGHFLFLMTLYVVQFYSWWKIFGPQTFSVWQIDQKVNSGPVDICILLTTIQLGSIYSSYMQQIVSP